MTTPDPPEGTPVHRPLTQEEKDLLAEITSWSVREQVAQKSGVLLDSEAVDEALGDFAEKSGLYLEADDYHAYMKTVEHGHVIVRCTREWLAFHAHSGEPLTEDELRRALGKGDSA